MAIYNPPDYIQNLNLFNPEDFITIEDGITPAYLDANYLKFPNAQGNEFLQAINVNGTLTANSGVSIPNNDMFVRNIRIGLGAGNQVRNTMLGVNNGNAITTGNNNTFIGALCGVANTTGRDNVFVGTFSGIKNTTGFQNTFIGIDAGNFTTTGGRNTHIGRQAGYYNTGSNNICIGDWADASGNISNSIAIGVDVKATANDVIVLGTSSHTTQIAGAVVVGSNSNLTMNAGTGRINQPVVLGDVSTTNSFKLSDFVFNSNNANGTATAFSFFDGFNGRGLYILPSIDSGFFGSTNRRGDCCLTSRLENNSAITISNYNTNMRNGLRVFTTDSSNCGLTLQCGQNSTSDWTEFAMNYNRGTNTTTTSFNNAINFNPTSTNSNRRLLSGLGTLSFTDISGNNSTNGSVVSRIWTDSSLVGGLNGMYYDCGINGGFHQFSARDGAGNVSTPIYYGANLTSVSNTFIVRNATITSNRFDIVGDTSQNTFIRGRSTTASTDAHIHFNCDTVNAGGTSTSNAVLNMTPTSINIRRPIQFNYLTTPSAFNQLGYSQGYDIPTTSFASSASIRNSASFSFTSAGTYLINWKPYAQMASGTATFTTFRFGIANTGGATFDADTQTYTSYMDLKVAYPTLTVNDNLNEPTSCVYTATASSTAYFNFLANYTGGTNINIGGYYTITRIG